MKCSELMYPVGFSAESSLSCEVFGPAVCQLLESDDLHVRDGVARLVEVGCDGCILVRLDGRSVPVHPVGQCLSCFADVLYAAFLALYHVYDIPGAACDVGPDGVASRSAMALEILALPDVCAGEALSSARV